MQSEAAMLDSTVSELRARVCWAKSKHPDWAGKGHYWALGVILDEVDELIHAVENETPERQKEEAKDVAATCIRFIQEEFK